MGCSDQPDDFLAAKIRTSGSMKKQCLEPTDGFQSTLHMFGQSRVMIQKFHRA